MSDPGILAAEQGIVAVRRRIKNVYKQAQKELKKTLQGYNLRFMAKDAEMRQKLADEVITKSEYDDWLAYTVFRGQEWDKKVEHCADVLTDANKTAMRVIRNEQIGVFAENMTYQAYELEKGVNANLGFGIYSSETVNNLLKTQPELLPRKVVNGKKDKAWNQKKIANEITKGIIKGDGIEDIADSLSKTLSIQNDEAMTRYARTAMTSAQNGGRMNMLHEAEDEGIKTKKKWIATLDSRTRDAHADLDGETAEIDEYFHADLGDGRDGDILYPGDPSADPANVYNCRCTLGYVIEGFEGGGKRRAYREWDDEEGHHKEAYLVENMSYKEWKKLHEADGGHGKQ